MAYNDMERLPLETQTLYSELLARLTTLEAHRSIGSLSGSFVTKQVKGETYYYFQHFEPGGQKRQVYIGKKGPALDRLVRDYQEGRSAHQSDAAQIQRLCAQLRAGGALVIDTASARVISALAESGVFRLGGVLVGTHAFTVMGNMLGIRWESAAVRTHDIDIAGEHVLAVALPSIQADIPETLKSLGMGFFPVPPFNPANPSTSFSIRGNPLRVDVLTPAARPTDTAPRFIPRFNTAAQPLRFLDFLIENPVQGAVVNGGGILVSLPDPARFAIHKLIISRERSVSEHQKRDKDLKQAGQVLELLADERPGDILLAWDETRRRGKGWEERVKKGLKALQAIYPISKEAMAIFE